MQMCLFAFVATIAVTELGLFQRIFDTVSLSASQWVTCLVVGAVIVVVMEVEKLISRKRTSGEQSEAQAAPAAPVAV